MKPSVLHLRASNFVGGPEKQILGYATCCSKEVNTIIASFCGASEGIEFLGEAASRGIVTLRLPAESINKSVRAVVNCVRNSGVRLICAHGYKPAVVATIVSKMTGVPYACFLRGSTKENWKVAFYERIERLCCRRADRVVCLSDTQANRLSNLYGRRVRIVVNAGKLRTYTAQERREAKERICKLAGLAPGQPLVVAAGRLSPEKGAATLVDSAALLCKSQPNFQFALFGDGVERERLRARTAGLGLESNVKLVGHHGNFPDLVCGADLLVNPSLTEEMPNVVLEAMSAGVPIIATSVGGVPELGRDGAIALVSPGNADQLAQTIQQLFSEPEKRLSMIDKAYDRLQEDYSLARQGQQLRALYNEFFSIADSRSVAVLPRISVVIPVRNEEKSLPAVLAALREQDYPSEFFEIVVADGLSTDRTVEQTANLANKPGAPIRVVENPGRLSSAGRNAGVAAVSGDIVMFCDGHCHIPSQTLLRDTAELFATTGADILCRPQPLDFPGGTKFQQLVAAARASWLGHGRDSTIYSTDFEGWVDPSSAGAIYRRALFEEFGGFDENFDACEDVEFNYRLHRASVKAYISPKLTILYEPRKDLSSLFRQMMRYGKGRARLARKYPKSSSLSQWIPAGLVVLLMSAPVVFFTPVFRIWLVTIAAYFAVVMIESGRITRRLSLAKLAVLPFIFFAIHTGLGIGLILEKLTGRPHPEKVPASFSKMTEAAKNVELATRPSRPQEIGIP